MDSTHGAFTIKDKKLSAKKYKCRKFKNRKNLGGFQRYMSDYIYGYEESILADSNRNGIDVDRDSECCKIGLVEAAGDGAVKVKLECIL